jgi:hypothetical protein
VVSVSDTAIALDAAVLAEGVVEALGGVGLGKMLSGAWGWASLPGRVGEQSTARRVRTLRLVAIRFEPQATAVEGTCRAGHRHAQATVEDVVILSEMLGYTIKRSYGWGQR